MRLAMQFHLAAPATSRSSQTTSASSPTPASRSGLFWHNKVQLDRLVPLEQPDLLERLVLEAQRVPQDPMVPQVQPVLQDPQGPQDQPDPQERMDPGLMQ
jgi:hypothetical protein